MNRPMLVLTVMMLLSSWPAAALPAPAAIRDIRGPIPPTGLPPFSATFLVLLIAGIGLVVIKTNRTGRKRTIDSFPLQSPAADDLSRLKEAYERGELAAVLLFQRLAEIASLQLIQNSSDAMTSAEVLEAAGETVSAEILVIAADLFATCDRVRFGSYRPDTATVDESIAAVRLLMLHKPGTAP